MECFYTNSPTDEVLRDDRVLAVIQFAPPRETSLAPRVFNTGLPHFGEQPRIEVWKSGSTVESGIVNGLHWSRCDTYQFVALSVPENQHRSLREASRETYCKLLHYIDNSKHPNILRTWNYLADINQGEDDEERYKQFCLGRSEAFEKNNRLIYPAATAIGHHGGNLMVYALCCKHPVGHFENPRQVMAYKYPRKYGLRSPSFSRAACVDEPSPDFYFISGTASIIGHESINADDIIEQIDTTETNIRLLCCPQKSENNNISIPELSMLKVYLRDPQNYLNAKHRIEQQFGTEVSALYLQGDVCRQELTVEIDALCQRN